MHVVTEIKIGGASLPFNVRSIRWLQSLYDYDRFTITLADPNLVDGSGPVADITQRLAAQLGQPVIVDLQSGGEEWREHLAGFVTGVRGRYVQRGVEVVLEGAGAAHTLDKAVHTRVFQQLTWKEIVEQILAPASSQLKGSTVKLGPFESVKVPFCCQYQETDFAFLRRVCGRLGLVLCAGGNGLVLVPAKDFKGIPGCDVRRELIPGANCRYVESRVQAVPAMTETAGYQHYGERGLQDGNYGDEETRTWSSTPEAAGGGLTATGLDSGRTLYTSPGSVHESGVHWSQEEFDNRVARWGMHAAGAVVRFEGRTWVPDLRLGHQAVVKPESALAVDWVSSESILVTSVEHTIEAGDYTNLFVGCSVPAPPLLNPNDFPPRQRFVTLPARVVQSDDPSRVGRVRVQPLVLESSWLPETIHVRVAARSAGPDHGELMLPEVGDEVLLAFHPDACEEPYVTAIFYNGTHKTLPDKLPAHTELEQAQVDKNDLKWVLTRGGNALIFDDTQGKERLLAVTKTGSLELSEVAAGPHMALTVRDGSEPMCILTFDKKGQVTLKATNVLFDIKESMEIKTGEHFTLDAKGKITLKAGEDYDLKAQGKVQTKSGTDTMLDAGTKATVKSGTDTSVQAGMNLKLQGAAQGELKSGAIMTIKSGLVKIN